MNCKEGVYWDHEKVCTHCKASIQEDQHQSLISQLQALRLLEWDKFNIKSLENSFIEHERVLNGFKDLITETNQIYETFLMEIINIGHVIGKDVSNYEEHFYTQLPLWYQFETKQHH